MILKITQQLGRSSHHVALNRSLRGAIAYRCMSSKDATVASSLSPRFKDQRQHQSNGVNIEPYSLKDFIQQAQQQQQQQQHNPVTNDGTEVYSPLPGRTIDGLIEAQHARPVPHKVFVETYGCQMNTNDMEIVLGILQDSGQFIRTEDITDANVVLLMTCAIRENAEGKIWSRLDALQTLKQQRKRHHPSEAPMKVGVLGCMAERLKSQLLEGRRLSPNNEEMNSNSSRQQALVDVVCGPDAYRDLPRLLDDSIIGGQQGMNVMLSLDETYADIAPVRLDPNKKFAYVSIMRGCDNMCAYCIVPFTRGRERSRPISSIVEEVQRLSSEGIKEVTLLGQNVNSYCDRSELTSEDRKKHTPRVDHEEVEHLSRGFRTIYKPKVGGRRFADLLDEVSRVDPEMRIRFTSPHPKDFPDELLYLMRDRDNICKQIHLPAQSGSTNQLKAMRRGYTREAYDALVDKIRSIIPEVYFSSDFISGFCDETEADHQDTLSLIQRTQYDMCYMYAYSMRAKTMAHRRLQDNVTESVKQRRLREVIDTFYENICQKVKHSIGEHQLVLVEGYSKKSTSDLAGRNDGGRKIVFAATPILNENDHNADARVPEVGEYVHVKVIRTVGATPIASPIKISSIRSFSQWQNQQKK